MATRTSQQIIGDRSEALARHHLEAQGMRLLHRNFRCKCGEIDLIMQHGDMIVFVEVRARKHSRFGSAAESINRTKQRKLINAAHYFIQRHDPQLRHSYRFDVIAIQGEPGNNPAIQWISSAF